MRTVMLPVRPICLIGLMACCLSIMGCGGEMKVAPVSGTVTLDGAPLDGVSVVFEPQDGGRPSFGVTDQSGRYTLDYSMHEQGAEVGPCIVKVSTPQPDESDDDGGEPVKRVPEKVPARYATDPIVVTVEPKSNTIDIPLTTKP